MASLEEIRAERIKKIEKLKDQGINPYPISSCVDFSVNQLVENFDEFVAENKEVSVAGRVMALRGQGAITFLNFDDGSGNFQALLKKTNLSEGSFDLFNDTVDIGDFVELRGTLFLTKRNEKTVEVKEWKMLAKSLRSLPDKWHGLQDVEEKYRRRYLDSIMDPEIRKRFIMRSKIISTLRSFLDSEGFLEVETPVLQPQYGGASAEPFITHHNTLDIDLYLRISPELYLKRMLIGGFPKVYEVARNFRNEGIDMSHNPEFTMVEFYESYSTAEKQRELVEKLLRNIVEKITGGLVINWGGEEINFTDKFKVVSYYDLLKRYALINDPATATRDELALKANQLGIEVAPADNKEKIFDYIYKKVCRPKLIQPTFIIDYPVDYLPLAKKLEGQEGMVDAFQVLVGGIELGKAFSELNDPLDQLERFQKQERNKAEGDKEAQPIDNDFVEAMEYGMPPAGGVGIGIDRLVMLLSGAASLREIIYFPTMRPRDEQKPKEEEKAQ